MHCLQFTVVFFFPSVCLSHPLSVLCVEATAVKRHFLGSHVLQPHEGRLSAKAVAPAISGRWFFNMFAVAKMTRTKSSNWRLRRRFLCQRNRLRNLQPQRR